ncbi:MAG: adenosylcobinamide-GDP ribazoletransferase [Bacillota bacterium]|nr:adenosylcobinamide-GDP ribazoletransferase [Bacillota bacterium]
MLKSLIIAFHTYSRIPMPTVEWDDKSMKNAICFFPCVGIVIGFLELVLVHLATKFNILFILKGALCSVLPIFITGGIHMDGFCDTTDALSSYQPRERKLEILKDSNAGAFAIIYAVVWFILYFASWCCIKTLDACLAVSIGFVMSRALSAFGVAIFKQARDKGMLKSYADKSDKAALKIAMIIVIAVCIVCLVLFAKVLGIAVVIAQLLSFLYYKYRAYKEFGGITGDTAGWFLQIAELTSVMVVAILSEL